jgi:predicted acylesterase/phospholipase RssA
MPIKHLVICGGGQTLFRVLGALNYLEKKEYWSLKDIRSIYGTSSGAIFGAMLCLKYDHATLENYLINRPWHEAFPIKMNQLLNAYTKKGVFDHTTVETAFKPLLSAKDLPLTVTLKELYEYSNIELHLYTLEINQFIMVDMSYKTHPDIPLTRAVAMSSAVPGAFAPWCDETGCYVDGGVLDNYPLHFCIRNGCDINEIFGIKFNYIDEPLDLGAGTNNESSHAILGKDSNIFDFLIGFFSKVLQEMSTENKQPPIPNELVCDSTFMTFDTLKRAICSLENRLKLYDSGVKAATAFWESKCGELSETPSDL